MSFVWDACSMIRCFLDVRSIQDPFICETEHLPAGCKRFPIFVFFEDCVMYIVSTGLSSQIPSFLNYENMD